MACVEGDMRRKDRTIEDVGQLLYDERLEIGPAILATQAVSEVGVVLCAITAAGRSVAGTGEEEREGM